MRHFLRKIKTKKLCNLFHLYCYILKTRSVISDFRDIRIINNQKNICTIVASIQNNSANSIKTYEFIDYCPLMNKIILISKNYGQLFYLLFDSYIDSFLAIQSIFE